MLTFLTLRSNFRCAEPRSADHPGARGVGRAQIPAKTETKKRKCGNAASQCVGERERDESLIANLEGGFAEVDRRCSGAGGAGDDVGHLDRALQSDGTTKCWAFWEEER